MNVVTLDFETYYDAEYSLSKLTVEEYVNDRRFQIIGVAIKDGDEPAVWYSFDTLEAYVKLLAPLSNRMVLCHNAAFDAAILSWRLGVRPKFLLDTLSMARPVLGHTKRHSLEALAEHFGLGAKGREVHDAKGKQLEDFDHDELVQYGRYCMNDVELTYKLFKKLGKGFPTEELRMIDLTLRMYTQPCLDLSAPTIWKEIELERERKDALMSKLGGFTTAADLRSNDKFAEVLRSLGVEPPTKVSVKKSEKAGHEVRTWAFAKADADFKALMNHDDPMVVAAVEARLGHKSTQKETRAQRFAGIAVRMGQLPVPLMYYGAHTGRYAATGSINLQNLPAVRGSKDPNAGLLRKAIIAPPGHKIVVADLSQIEARLAMWLAGQIDKVEAFAQGRDIYSEQASVIYSRHVDRKKNPATDAIPGFVGKCVILGCFAEDTKVLTDAGWKYIVDVTTTDLVWDGEEWVNHQGIAHRGEKEVLEWRGVSATSDHEILTEHGWREWSEVLASSSLWRSALSSASSPSSTGSATRKTPAGQLGGNHLCGARAGTKAWSTGRIFSRAAQLAAKLAEGPLRRKGLKTTGSTTGGTRTSSPITQSERRCSTGSHRSLVGAGTGTTNSTKGMAEGASQSPTSGSTIARVSCAILKRFEAMAISLSRSTESTMTADTCQATSGSQRERRTSPTAAQSRGFRASSTPSRRKTQTYDVVCAGPRNRFTILTEDGPIIAHNCQYGLGHPKFGGMIYVGMLGGKGILFDQAFAEQMSADVRAYTHRVSRDDDLAERIAKVKPLDVDDETWLTHMACADHIVNVYRADNRMVKNFWSVCGRAIEAMHRGEEFSFGGPDGSLLRTEHGAIVLPNGLKLLYPGLERDEKTKEYSFLRKKEGRVQRVRVYGGALLENICQALARIVIGGSMLKADAAGYRVALQVHDEIVLVVREEEAETAYKNAIAWMRTPPTWAEGLPLDAEGGIADRYGDAK